MPNNEWFRALVEAIRLTIVVFITGWLGPVIAAEHESAPAFLIDLVVAFLTALGLFVLQLIIFANAHVTVEWVREMESHPLLELDVHIDPETKDGRELYRIRVLPGQAYGFGWVALRLGARWGGLHVRAGADHAALWVHVDGPNDLGPPRAMSEGISCAVLVLLRRPVPRDGVWQSVLVRFSGRQRRASEPSELRHTVSGANWFGKVCGKLVKVDAGASRVVERWG